MTQHLRITNYRLAFWHAPKRARHEEGDDLDCIFCQYSEGVARINDVTNYLERLGFTISSFDDHSLTISFSDSPDSPSKPHSRNRDDLVRIISGK